MQLLYFLPKKLFNDAIVLVSISYLKLSECIVERESIEQRRNTVVIWLLISSLWFNS